MGVTTVVVRASQLAAGQWGLLTTAQAEIEGITRLQLARLADVGVLERLGRGVYATATALGDEHLGLRAAWLVLDPSHTAAERLRHLPTAGVVSHASAAGLHGLGDLLDDEHAFTLPHRRQTRRPGIVTHRAELTDGVVTIVDGLPVTTPARTVVDLVNTRHDPDHVAQIVGQAALRGMLDVTNLAAQLDPLARRNGHTDGISMVESMMDAVGLSPAALERQLAATPAGRALVSSGSNDAIARIMAALQASLAPRGPGITGTPVAALDIAPPDVKSGAAFELHPGLRRSTATVSSRAGLLDLVTLARATDLTQVTRGVEPEHQPRRAP